MKRLNFTSLLMALSQCLGNQGKRVTAANTVSVARLYDAMGYPLEPSADLAGSGGVFAANSENLDAARTRTLAANDANLDGFHLDMGLTQFATGAPDTEGLQALLDAIAPPVPVGHFYNYLRHTEAEERQAHSLTDLIRPVGGEFAQVRLTGSRETGEVPNIGLTTFVDDSQGGGNPLVQQRHVLNLTQRILRAQLVFTLGLIDAASTDAGSTNWGASTSNPDANMRADLRSAKLARGTRSTVMLIGDAAWLYRQDAYEQPDRTNSGTKAQDTPEQLASRLRCGSVIIADETKRSSATALADIVGSATYNFHVDPVATTNDMSNVKQMVVMGASGQLEVFIERLTKRWKITVSKYADTKITSDVGIRKRTVTYS